jgi:hypothetical protein
MSGMFTRQMSMKPGSDGTADEFPKSHFYKDTFPLMLGETEDFPLPRDARDTTHEALTSREQMRDQMLSNTLFRAGYRDGVSAGMKNTAVGYVLDHIRRVFPVVFGSRQMLQDGFRFAHFDVKRKAGKPAAIVVSVGYTAHHIEISKSTENDGTHVFSLEAAVGESGEVAVSSRKTVEENKGMFALTRI